MKIQPFLCGTCGRPVNDHTIMDKDCSIIKILKEVWQRDLAEELK